LGRLGTGIACGSCWLYEKSPIAVASKTWSLGPDPSAEAESASGVNFRPSNLARPSLVSTSKKPSSVEVRDKTTGDGSPSVVV
jgi:hypothetical protein